MDRVGTKGTIIEALENDIRPMQQVWFVRTFRRRRLFCMDVLKIVYWFCPLQPSFVLRSCGNLENRVKISGCDFSCENYSGLLVDTVLPSFSYVRGMHVQEWREWMFQCTISAAIRPRVDIKDGSLLHCSGVLRNLIWRTPTIKVL